MKKIVVVDDHPVVLSAIKIVLSSALSDISILCVTSAKEMRSLLHEHTAAELKTQFIMAFVDLHLPDANGVDLIEELAVTYGIPVIALSGNADQESVDACINRGASGFIEKTTKVGIFPAAVNVILSGGKFFPPPPARKHESKSQIEEKISSLTVRQTDVLNLLLDGKPNKIIASALGLSEGTVKNHVGVLLDIFRVNSRSQLILATNKLGYKPASCRSADIQAPQPR